MFEIKKIKPEMTYDLRHRILRPHRPIEDIMYETDHEAGAFNVGAFDEERLISIVSFCDEQHPDLPEKKQYRLRAMATLDEYRKQGAGKSLVTFAEKLLKEQSVDLLWCKGRTTVQNYYKKLGFEPHGEVFDYPTLGPHIVMVKKLN